jgi:hypothetical protein
MYDNDRYGDCTCAAVGHMIQAWTASAKGKTTTPSVQSILKLYEHFTPPGPENGCNMLDVLKYWRSPGVGGHKITAFARLEPRNTTEAMDALALFGGCYIGVALPNFAVSGPDLSQIPWVVPPQGPTGDAAPNAENGHCINAVAYDQRNVYVVTWGAVKSMSWEFYKAYSDESYALLSGDFLANGKSPAGFDENQLKSDLNEIVGIPTARAAFLRR